ncbi:uncharacterized protein LY79DRAFT_591046 [Colletotrichum navitas]|uniref:RING-type domain-containing protein n=1 Tax=Colletotrichum navitas TaxID=681940 RepID=A0AAD8PYN5_9PEZI|nr:uncharacterized protein LY79DRAFT_591046 [Colletotrichum navitas]KAK1586143.1 hypothetical protein LY79DRAFT_591046 [Colletotrichum navitas]
MCIELWRRYFCPKAPNHTPTSDLNLGTDVHPQPREDVAGHCLVQECDNVFRENQESPQDNVDEGRQIHWIYNLVRCAHLYSHECARSPCIGGRVQHFDRPCPYCTGGIDVHVRDYGEILRDVSLPLKIPATGRAMDPEVVQRFEHYREKYLLRLLRLFHVVLLRSLPVSPESETWKSFIEIAWPETFCKLDFDHIGHGVVECECPATKEEWRTNSAYSKRKNEALAILNGLEARSGPRGAYVYFWWTEGFGTDADWEPTDRANGVYSKYDEENDFLPHQMQFVNFKQEDYDRRYSKLQTLADNCLRQLKERGKDVSQEHPKTGYWQHCGIKWMGFDEWESSLNRRMEFLEWVYQFLALDAGLHENVMMYLAAALLAMLNPWPNPQIEYHPSHPSPYALDSELAAYDVLQECIWWVEYLWPLDGDLSVQDSYRESINASSEVNRIIQRNRDIELLDMKSRNRTAAHKTGLFILPPEVAIAQGDEICPLCQEEWGHFPFHEPVQLPCCNKFVGRRCMKQFLASKPIRPAGGNYMRREKWVEEFRCALCREGVGHHFSPHFYGQLLGDPPKDIRDFSFYDDYEGFPKPSEYWR